MVFWEVCKIKEYLMADCILPDKLLLLFIVVIKQDHIKHYFLMLEKQEQNKSSK